MKKGNRKIIFGLLGIFLLLVGMYVYHVNSLKEGVFGVSHWKPDPTEWRNTSLANIQEMLKPGGGRAFQNRTKDFSAFPLDKMAAILDFLADKVGYEVKADWWENAGSREEFREYISTYKTGLYEFVTNKLIDATDISKPEGAKTLIDILDNGMPVEEVLRKEGRWWEGGEGGGSVLTKRILDKIAEKIPGGYSFSQADLGEYRSLLRRRLETIRETGDVGTVNDSLKMVNPDLVRAKSIADSLTKSNGELIDLHEFDGKSFNQLSHEEVIKLAAELEIPVNANMNGYDIENAVRAKLEKIGAIDSGGMIDYREGPLPAIPGTTGGPASGDNLAKNKKTNPGDWNEGPVRGEGGLPTEFEIRAI